MKSDCVFVVFIQKSPLLESSETKPTGRVENKAHQYRNGNNNVVLHIPGIGHKHGALNRLAHLIEVARQEVFSNYGDNDDVNCDNIGHGSIHMIDQLAN